MNLIITLLTTITTTTDAANPSPTRAALVAAVKAWWPGIPEGTGAIIPDPRTPGLWWVKGGGVAVGRIKEMRRGNEVVGLETVGGTVRGRMTWRPEKVARALAMRSDGTTVAVDVPQGR